MIPAGKEKVQSPGPDTSGTQIQKNALSYEGLAKSNIVSICTRTGTNRLRLDEGLQGIGT